MTFGRASVYLDAGHDVIDATFLRDGDTWYRFSANAQGGGGRGSGVGEHILIERGAAIDAPDFTTVRVDVGHPELTRGEGPAVFSDAEGTTHYLLIDEFLGRGYQLFRTADVASGDWEHVSNAQLPPGARHGSVISISLDEYTMLKELT